MHFHSTQSITITIFTCVVISLSACNKEKEPSILLKSHFDMIELLEEVKLKSNPAKNYYANTQRVELIKKQIGNNRSSKNFNLLFTLCLELVNSGNTHEAIAELNSLIKINKFDIDNINKDSKQVFKLLGVAYMRKGELDNCLENHSSASCILPLESAGVHIIPDGSQQAIGIYKKILTKYPKDYNSLWLLNLAYITLGNYPDKVPQQWLIKGMSGSKDGSTPLFKNVLGHSPIAVNNLSGGTCVDDFNNDGFIDILASSWGLDHNLNFFINDGKGGFIDNSESAGLDGIYGGLNTVHADYNNDGYIDVFVLRGAWLVDGGQHPNSLLQNNGDGTFTDGLGKAIKIHSVEVFWPNSLRTKQTFTDITMNSIYHLKEGNSLQKLELQQLNFEQTKNQAPHYHNH